MSTSSGAFSFPNSPSSEPLSPLSSPVVVDGEAREPPNRRRAFLFDIPPLEESFFRESCWTRGRLRPLFIFLIGRGPTLPALLTPGVTAFGVPGPREECLTVVIKGGGKGPKLALRRLRLGSIPADISRCLAFRAVAGLTTGGFAN